ncbi:TetR/AcrR family transcriptional regulator [Desmospora activa]|uniref:TetR family transcriptional regulator n=1 Tax=Desmospora activa DSM 45169 TaxID=1121389 RepID=A0A2T4Z792_9BACL|nr:TetR/AcrR family transcriptional regulator [Desmospora activa]PTM57767.1 TetR family transcriptional regulator [Desmospora activa DSM 45169]
MDGYQLRTEKKKEQILKTTFELICTFGANKTSIAEVAKKANVSPVSIYNYFGSKDQLIQKSLLRFVEKKIEEYEAILEQDIPFSQKMDQIMFDGGEAAKNIEQDLYRANIDDTVIQAYIEECYQTKTIPFFKKLVDQGKKEGVIDPHLSLESVLLFIQMFKEAFARPGFFAHATPAMLRDIEHLLYYGLIGKAQMDQNNPHSEG